MALCGSCCRDDESERTYRSANTDEILTHSASAMIRDDGNGVLELQQIAVVA